MVSLLGCSVWSQKLDSMILLDPFQLRSLSLYDGAHLHSNYALSPVFLQNFLMFRRSRQELAFFFFLNLLLLFEVWELSPSAFLSLLLMHIQLYTKRQTPEQTGKQNKAKNERITKGKALIIRVMFCWSRWCEQRFIRLFEQKLNGVSSHTAE